MKLIARVLGILVGILLVVLSTILIITPQTVADAITRIEEVQLSIRIVLVVVIYLLLLGMLYLQFRFGRRRPTDALTVHTSGTITAVTVESVRERILKAVSEVPDVASVNTVLKSYNGRADVELNVTTSNDQVNVPEKQKEISRALDQVIKKQLGLQMAGRPRISIELGAQPSKAPVLTSPPPPVTMSTPVPPPAVVTTPPPAVVTPPPVVEMSAPEVEITPPPRVETPEERRASLFSRFTTVQDEPEVEEVVEEDDDEATETGEPEADADVNADLYTLLDEDRDNKTDKLNNE